MKLKKVLTWLTFPIIALAAIIPAVVVTSCSCSNSQETSQQSMSEKLLLLNQKYIENEKKFVSSDSQLPKFTNPETNSFLIPSFKSIIDNANNAINELTKFKKDNNLNQNQMIWIDSYIFQWNNKIKNIESGMVFLGQNPLVSSRPLSTSANHIRDNVKDSLNIYPLNPETGDPDKTKAPDKQLINSITTKAISCKNLINDYKNYLKFGSENFGIQPSTISKKLLINQLLTFFFSDQLDRIANETNQQIWTIDKILPATKTQYFNDILKTIKTNVDTNQYNNIEKAVDELYQSLREFMIFYSTSYYKDKSSFGPKHINDFSLSKTSNNEVEKTIISSNGTKLYGAGLTDNDLNEKNIGMGFMNIIQVNVPAGYLNNGNDLYQQMLNNNNSIKDQAIDIYNLGIKLSTEGMNSMTNIATESKKLIIGNLNNQIDYDPDGIGSEPVQKLNLIGNDFEKFNKWLNQEDFFWGREVFTTENEKNDYINKYWTNITDPELIKYKQIIIDQGYESHWANANTINGMKTGTVSGNQALAGAVLSLRDYIQFKKSTDSVFDSNFNPIKDYVIAPYNYNIREDIGVGMEGPRGSCQFQYNCDPYYSLPKWSVSSLTNHEGKMGHHTQQEYWTEYLEGKDGTNNQGPGYTFLNDAFHEGWAVFAEWFGNELEIYGTNLDPQTRMPTNWLNAKGLVPQYDKNKVTDLTNQMKQLHGGVYYNKVIGEDNSDIKLQNSIKLANMLQYYGFLNEAQLRNMRLCLDVAYHYSGQSTNSSLPFGASIKQVRDFMKANSALSIGDINSESIRYLAIPSQATGYMLGKNIFQDLYKKVQIKLQTDLSTNKTEVKKLFDLMLRNGEIPLEVLKQQINNQYKLQ